MRHDSSNKNGKLNVSISNVTRWQRSILQCQFYEDDRFSIIEPTQSIIRNPNADAIDIHLRLIGFNASRPGDDEVFIEALDKSPIIPTIALIATPADYVACELPSAQENRVLMPLNPDTQEPSVQQFYIALHEAVQHSLQPKNIVTNAEDHSNNKASNKIIDLTPSDTATSGVSASIIPSRINESSQSTKILAIGSSTGGPRALQVLLKTLPQNLNVPIVVAQHMPSTFTASLARQLNQNSALSVTEANHQEILKEGHVYIAPGDKHMRVRRLNLQQVCVEVSEEAPVNFCRPSVDVLFESAALAYGSSCIGVVLTGMGIDGLAGSTALSKGGAKIIVQNEESSVVWGMPGSIVAAGLANEVIHIEELGRRLTAMLENKVAA